MTRKEIKYFIPEMELSINNICNLQCEECGFLSPNQPRPSISNDVIEEHKIGLLCLDKLHVGVGNLAVLGGEPTLTPKILEEAIELFSGFDNIDALEVVTNGLFPQGITTKTMKLLKKLTISFYFESDLLVALWKAYIEKYAPHILLSFRVDKEWDLCNGNITVNDIKAQALFNNCWYRKHCVTIERRRLFLCSRAPKTEIDEAGIVLGTNTCINDIRDYLNQAKFIKPCKTCLPAMGFPKIKAGRQPEIINVEEQLFSAIKFFQRSIILKTENMC